MTPERIYLSVANAMQEAEEIGGPEGDEYINLMRRIARLATLRADVCAGLQPKRKRRMMDMKFLTLVVVVTLSYVVLAVVLHPIPWWARAVYLAVGIALILVADRRWPLRR